MTIGLPTELSLTSTDVTDGTTTYDATEQTSWRTDDTIQHEGSIYGASRDMVVEDFSYVKTDYKVGDLVHGYSIYTFVTANQVCTSFHGRTQKQPSEYENLDISADHTTWTTRYMMIRFSPYTFQFNNLDYTFTPNGEKMNVTIKSIPPNTALDINIDLPRVRLVTDITIMKDAELHVNPDTGADYWIPNFVFEDDTGLYVRTNVATTIEYGYYDDIPIFEAAITPALIRGFYKIGATNDYAPFDNKNYTRATKDTSLTYTIQAEEPCNMFTLGYMLGDTFDYTVKDHLGTTIDTDSGVVIDGRRDDAGILKDGYTTIPVYFSSTIQIGGTVTITIYRDVVELGSLMLAMGADMGMTNLTLINTYKDYSLFESSPWGDIDYVDRARVSVYSGTVDVPVTQYDIIDRFFTSLGKQLIIMDGSDSTSNDAPDSENIFAATRKIGRIMTYKQKTKVKYDDIDPLVQYDFSLEAII